MTKITTVKGNVRQEVKDRLTAIAREQGRASDDELVAEVLERYVAAYDRDAVLIEEALGEARAGGPFIAGEDMEAWAASLGTGDPQPRPKATIYTRSRA